MLEADFWQDKDNSKKVIKEKKLFEDLLNTYKVSIERLSDLDDLSELVLEEKNDFVQKEVFQNLKELRTLVKKKVAIEYNGVIIPKVNFKKKILKNNDKIEIVHFIGGG